MRKSETAGMPTSGMNLVAAGGNAHPCTFPNFFLLLFFNFFIIAFWAFSPQLKSRPQTPTPSFSVRKSVASCHMWAPHLRGNGFLRSPAHAAARHLLPFSSAYVAQSTPTRWFIYKSDVDFYENYRYGQILKKLYNWINHIWRYILG